MKLAIQISLLWSLLSVALGQPLSNSSLSIQFNTGSCPSGQYFDTSSLSCISCPSGFVVSDNGLGCKECDTTSGFFYDTLDGFGTAMTWAASPSVSTCSCPSSVNGATISATVFVNGTFRQRCVLCPTGYTTGTNAFGQPACLPPSSSGSTSTLSPQLMFNAAVAKLNGVNPSYTSAITVSKASLSLLSGQPLTPPLSHPFSLGELPSLSGRPHRKRLTLSPSRHLSGPLGPQLPRKQRCLRSCRLQCSSQPLCAPALSTVSCSLPSLPPLQPYSPMLLLTLISIS